jgi:UTP--glucose-1-phosphate uridylyltransferase
MKIKKALITAAGFGTRFFPITKTIQKEMLPILNRPIIDYIVEDLVIGGIEEIVIVVRNDNSQVQKYYSEDIEVLEYLERMGKTDKYEMIKDIHTKAKFSFITQPADEPYGTATPVKIAKDELINEEAFLVFMGDDYVFNNGNSMAKDMIDLYHKSEAGSLINCIEVDKSLVSKYGIAEFELKNEFKFMTSLIEKPYEDETDSNLANISKYIFTPEVFEILDRQKVNEGHSELLITDTISLLSEKGSSVVINTPTGEYIDTGYLEGWLHANKVVANSLGLNY